jgi:MHS family proline/betaine transporter-like MFS transporter
MGVSTLLIGLLPTHQPYVIYSPLLLLIFRMMQGLSVGGEFGGSVTFCLEHAPPNRRGFYASIPMAALIVGLLFGALIPTVIFYNVTIAQRDAWAWRIPYLFSGVLAIIGYGMRARMQETPVFCYLLKNNCTCPFPITTSLQFAFREILKVAAIVSFAVVSVIQIYGAIYLAHVHRITHLDALLFSITGLCIMLCLMVVSGYLSAALSNTTFRFTLSLK